MSALISAEALAAAYLTPAQQEERIRRSLACRRADGTLGPLPECPQMVVAGRYTTTNKRGWVEAWSDVGAEARPWDWAEMGFDQYDSDWMLKGKMAFNRLFVDEILRLHEEKPIDILMCYVSGRWVYPETIQRVRDLGIITINLTMDDTFKFWGQVDATGFSGGAGLARVFDIFLTAQNPYNVAKHAVLGGNPLYLAPGGDNVPWWSHMEPPPAKRKYGVSFVGAKYGHRERLIAMLQESGIEVAVRGQGWEEGPCSIEEMGELMRNSLITLGFGYITNTKVTGLKGRDFAAPMMGAAYLTTNCLALNDWYDVGKEIAVYQDDESLLAQVKYYLAHPNEVKALGMAGRKRALAEHKWADRWRKVLALCRRGGKT